MDSLLSVQVAKKAFEAQDICSLDLRRSDGSSLPGFTAGAHVDLYLPGGRVRQYSLCNDPRETHRYVLGVLRDPHTRGGSRAVHDAVREGDTLQISLPRNHFELDGAAGRSLLLAGGIGITPLLSMAERLAAAGADFDLHYCVRSAARTAFRRRILESSFLPRVTFHFDDGPAEQQIDFDQLLGNPAPRTHLYVCGPQGFIEGTLAAAERHHWPADCVHREFFAARPAHSGSGSFEVLLAKTNRIVIVPADRSVVQALGDAGVSILTSCEQGVCGTCVTRVLAGEPEHRDLVLTDVERAANNCFIPCCSRAKSRRLVLDL